MRTPGQDLDLVAGWLVAEAGVRRPTEVVTLGAFAADPSSDGETDTVRIALAEHIAAPHPKSLLTSSSCGVCSSRVINEVPEPMAPLRSPGWSIDVDAILQAPDTMRGLQRVFNRTGGVHAASLISSDGKNIVTREDVGRHNAVDKVIGHALMSGLLPLTDSSGAQRWRAALHWGRSATARDVTARRPHADRRAAAGPTLADMGTRLAVVEAHCEEIRATAGRHRALKVSVFGSVDRLDGKVPRRHEPQLGVVDFLAAAGPLGGRRQAQGPHRMILD
jgi:hypothetical protein